MFLEYCQDGDLKEYIKKRDNKMLSEPEAVKFFKHLVEGFKELYKLKIIHRDIKPANILLSGGRAKISDFGFSRIIENIDDVNILSFVGSPLYMSPEILSQQPFSSKCDVWSAGILLFEMLYGKTPWSGTSQINLYKNIKEQPLSFPNEPVRSSKVKNLIKKMLTIHEKDRFSWPEVFEDDLITENRRFLEESMRRQQLLSGTLEKSLIENETFLQQNLVVNYLLNVEDDDNAQQVNQQEQYKYDNKFNQLKINSKSQSNNHLLIQNKSQSSEDEDGKTRFEIKGNARFLGKQEPSKNVTVLGIKKGNEMRKQETVHEDQEEEDDFTEEDHDQDTMDERPNVENNPLKQFEINQIGHFKRPTIHSNNSLDTDKKDIEECKEEAYFFEEKAEEWIKAQMEAEKIRKNLLKVNEYILYERNISFFYNFVIQRIISACYHSSSNIDNPSSEHSVQVPPLLYFRVVFLISKCQNSNLQKISQMMASSTSQFQQTIWDSYQTSLDFLKTQNMIVQDIWFAKRFYSELLKKTSSLVEEALHSHPQNQQLLQIKPFFDSKFISDQPFKLIYKNTLGEFITFLKPSAKSTQNKDILVVLKYLLTCLNPYSVFDKTDFDFSRFYEKIENDQINLLRSEVLTKLSE